jgi:hypothetical protein
VGPDSLRGPAFFDTDAALLKNLVLTERFALQFRAVVTNVFNWVNLGLPMRALHKAILVAIGWRSKGTTLSALSYSRH